MSDQAVRPAAESAQTTRLLDGRVVSLRRLGVGDADAVYALHRQLSDHDRYFRFFTLQPVSLHELAGKLTETDGPAYAVGAFDAGRLIGVAHYTVGDAEIQESPETPEIHDANDAHDAHTAGPAGAAAEVAVVVAHEDHSQGVGTALLKSLARIARARGIDRFVADVLGENHLMLTVFYDLGWPCEPRGDGPVRHLELLLPDNT